MSTKHTIVAEYTSTDLSWIHSLLPMTLLDGLPIPAALDIFPVLQGQHNCCYEIFSVKHFTAVNLMESLISISNGCEAVMVTTGVGLHTTCLLLEGATCVHPRTSFGDHSSLHLLPYGLKLSF